MDEKPDKVIVVKSVIISWERPWMKRISFRIKNLLNAPILGITPGHAPAFPAQTNEHWTVGIRGVNIRSSTFWVTPVTMGLSLGHSTGANENRFTCFHIESNVSALS